MLTDIKQLKVGMVVQSHSGKRQELITATDDYGGTVRINLNWYDLESFNNEWKLIEEVAP